MRDYIKYTYYTFTKYHKDMERFMQDKYINEHRYLPYIAELFPAHTLSERLMQEELMIKNVLDPYNVYRPAFKPKTYDHIDWTDDELNQITKWHK